MHLDLDDKKVAAKVNRELEEYTRNLEKIK